MEDLLVTKSECSSIIGVSTTAIDQWRQTKDFNKCYTGDKISLVKVTRWLYEWKNEEANKDNSDASETKKYWDSKRSELAYKTAINELIPTEEVLSMLIEILLLVKTNVMSQPDKFGNQFELSTEQKKEFRKNCISIVQSIQSIISNKKEEWIKCINKPLVESLTDDTRG